VLLTLFLPHVLQRLVTSVSMLLSSVRFLWWLSAIVACVELRLEGSRAVRTLIVPAIASASIVGFGYVLPRFRLDLPPPRQRLGIAVLGGLSHSQAVGGIVHLLIEFQLVSLWLARPARHSWQSVGESTDGEMVRLLRLTRPVFRAVYRLSVYRVVESRVFPHVLGSDCVNDCQVRAT